MNFIISLRSEILKTKRTAAFYFMVIGAAVIPLITLLSLISHGMPEQQRHGQEPINFLFQLSAEVMSICFFPLFVALACTLLPQIEYKNSAWKQVLTSPQTKLNVYISKIVNIQILMLLFMVTSFLYTWVVVFITYFIRPEIHILQHPFYLYPVLKDYSEVYISTLAIFAIQYWMGLRLNNFIAPIAIGIACWLTGTIMVLEYKSAASLWFPYSFHVIRLSDEFQTKIAQTEWTSFAYCIVILVLGFFDFNRRKFSK